MRTRGNGLGRSVMSAVTTTIIIFRRDRKRMDKFRQPKVDRKKWENYDETNAEVISRVFDKLERISDNKR